MEGLLVAKLAQDAGRRLWGRQALREGPQGRGRPSGKGQAWGFSGGFLFLTLSPAGHLFIYTGSTHLLVHAAL